MFRAEGDPPRRRLRAALEAAPVMLRHATLLVEWWGREEEGVTDFRKHVAWYLKGFPAGGELDDSGG